MADIQFRMNSQAFDLFRTASFDNENTIANLDGKNAVKSGGVLSKNIFRSWGRSDAEKLANNAITPFIEASINGYLAAEKVGKKTDGWTWKDVAETVKKSLVGKNRPIMVQGPAGFVNLTEGDKEVTRKVTAEDVDKIGQTCMDILATF